MKSLSFPLVFSSFFLLFVQVACLEIVVQPQTVAGGTSLAFWARDASDPPTFNLELHFSCGAGARDRGVAYPEVVVTADQTFGALPIVFPTSGTYTLKAVDPTTNQVLGVSNAASVVAPLLPVTPAPLPTTTPPLPSPTFTPATSPLTTSTPSSQSTTSTTSVLTSSTSSATHTTSPTSSASSTSSAHSPTATTSSHSASNTSKPATHSAERRNVNLPAVVGGVVGAIVLLGLLVALAFFLVKRRKEATRRYTFHQDMMVQPHDASTNGPQVSITHSNATFEHDLESGPDGPPVVPSPFPFPAQHRKPVSRGIVPLSAPAVNPLRHDLVDRPHSPITPRTKRNFFAVANNPFNPEAEAFAEARPVASSVESHEPMPPLPNPHAPEASNPFQDPRKEPEMVQVPPSPRVPSSALVIPSPRGPRPSIRR